MAAYWQDLSKFPDEAIEFAFETAKGDQEFFPAAGRMVLLARRAMSRAGDPPRLELAPPDGEYEQQAEKIREIIRGIG